MTMSQAPPLPKQKKKTGCVTGCIATGALCAAGFFAFAVFTTYYTEAQWTKNRGPILESVRSATEKGDYQHALSIAAAHRFRHDAELDALVTRVYDLQRAAAESQRQERIRKLVSEIPTLKGAERKEELERLHDLAPDLPEFAEEFAALREERKRKAEESRAREEAERRALADRKQKAEQEQFRQAMDAKLAEFKWKYQTVTDALTSKPAYHARVSSINRVNFGFPYQGEQRGVLVLRTHPQYGKDVFVRVDRGQMLVSSFQESNVKVVFDQGSPITYRVAAPADHSNTTAFIRDYHGFVERMLKAKKVKISVPFYQQGEVVFEFNVMDFDADRYLGKTASEP